MVDEAEVPVLRMVQVGEAAVDQRAHEVECERRALVTAQQQFRVGGTRLGGELRAVHQVAAIARQRDAAARLGIGRARLGVLPGHASDADDRLLQPVQQHQAHLQQDLQLLGDGVRFAIGERSRRSRPPAAGTPRRAARPPGASAAPRSPRTPRSAAGARSAPRCARAPSSRGRPAAAAQASPASWHCARRSFRVLACH